MRTIRFSDAAGRRCRQRLQRRPLGRYRYVRLRWRVLFALVDLLGAVLWRIARALRGRTAGRGPAAAQRADHPNVVLLVQLDHLGDAILSTAMLPALRERYPRASIEVLCGAWNREVFEASAEVDRVHVSRVNRFARSCLRVAWIPATIWWGLRLRGKVDLGVDVRGEFPVAVILWLAGARRRVGWDCAGGGFLLTDQCEFVPDRPELQSRRALLNLLGVPGPRVADAWRPRLRPCPQAEQRVARWLAQDGLPDGRHGPRVVFHLGAGTQAKQWPVRHWQELLGRVLVDCGAQVVLAGSDADRTTAARVLGGRPWPRVIDWTGRLGLVELAALLRRADLLVGTDSGPAHLAAAVDTPAIVLFSGTNNPRQWQPRGRHVVVLRHRVECSPCHRARCPWVEHPCMAGLHPRQVAAAVRGVLGGLRARDPESPEIGQENRPPAGTIVSSARGRGPARVTAGIAGTADPRTSLRRRTESKGAAP